MGRPPTGRVHISPIQVYSSDLKRVKVLSKEEFKEIWLLYKETGEESYRSQLLESVLKLNYIIARSHLSMIKKYRNIDLDDLISVCNLSSIEALEKWDPDHHTQGGFASLAAQYSRTAIKKFLEYHGNYGGIHIPRTTKKKVGQIEKDGLEKISTNCTHSRKMELFNAYRANSDFADLSAEEKHHGIVGETRVLSPMEKKELEIERQEELDFIVYEMKNLDLMRKRFGLGREAISIEEITKEYGVKKSTVHVWIREECKRLSSLIKIRRMFKMRFLSILVSLCFVNCLQADEQLSPSPNPFGNTILVTQNDWNTEFYQNMGMINISGGGSIANSSFFNNSGGLNIGGSFNNSDFLSNSGSIVVSGTLENVGGGGDISNSGFFSLESGATFNNSGFFSNTGTFDVNGSFNNTNFFDNFNGGIVNLNVAYTSSSFLANSNGTFNSNANFVNDNFLLNNGIFNNNSTFTNNDGLNNDGVFNNVGSLINQSWLDNRGSLILGSSSLNENRGQFWNWDVGEINGDMNNYDTLTNDGLLLGSLNNFGVLNGVGLISGILFDNGDFEPGSFGSGTFSIDGDYFKTGGSLDFMLNDESNNMLHVTGDVNLGGNLDVFAFGNLSRDNYEILRVDGSKSINGLFAGLPEGALVGNYGGTDLFITYLGGSGNDVFLYSMSAIPETTCMFPLLILSLVCFSRQRVRPL